MSKAADQIGESRERAQIIQSVSRVMTEGEETLDQEARDCAKDAMSKLNTHEVLCTERWGQQRAALETLTVSVARLQNSFDGVSNKFLSPVAVGLIAGLMGLCGWLAARAFPLPH